MYKIIVLMSTYNGEKYLKEQIDSILNQTVENLFLLVRDDGSTDGTTAILDKYQNRGKLKWYSGDNLGPCHSFLHLLKNCEKAEYYAFSDQDDYWCPDKLKKGILKIKRMKGDIPVLYFSKKIIVDSYLNILNEKDSVIRLCTFGISLMNSSASGCTMILNNNTRDLVKQFNPRRSVMHDAFIYRLISAVGIVIYDENSYIKYRQHETNVVGAPKSFTEKWQKRFNGFSKRYRENYRSNYAKDLIEGYSDLFSERDYKLCYQMANSRESFKCRIQLFLNKDLKTQIPWEILFLKFFILLGWI